MHILFDDLELKIANERRIHKEKKQDFLFFVEGKLWKRNTGQEVMKYGRNQCI